MTTDVQQLTVGMQVTGEVVTIYAAYRETYERSEIASYHVTEHDARIGASGLGYSGPDGAVKPVLALKLAFGGYALAPVMIEIANDAEAEAKVRKGALDKLSPAERAALFGRDPQ